MQKTRLLLFLTILLSPLYVIRLTIFSFPSTLLEILIVVTIITWLVERNRIKKSEKLEYVTNSYLNLLIFFFLMSAAVSIYFSPDRWGALGIFRAYFVEPVLIFLVAKEVIKTKEDFKFILKSLLWSGAWVSVLALVQSISGWFIFAPHEAAAGRVHGVYNSANALGLYLGPIIAISIANLQLSTINSQFINIILMILAIFLSKSTGALVGLLAIFITFAVVKIYKSKPGLRRVIDVIFYLLISIFLYSFIYLLLDTPSFTPKVSEPKSRTTHNTLLIRTCLWEGAVNLLRDHPIKGAGLSGFKELYSQKYYTCDAEPFEYPHNIILNTWTETGLLGLLSFVLLVLYYFNQNSQLATNNSQLKTGFAAVMIYILIHGLVDVPYFKNDLSLQFWIIYALLIKYSSFIRNDS